MDHGQLDKEYAKVIIKYANVIILKQNYFQIENKFHEQNKCNPHDI